MAVKALAVVLDVALGHEGAHDGAHGRADEVLLRASELRRRLDESPEGPRSAVEGLLQSRVVDHLLQGDEGAHAGLEGRPLEPLDPLNHVGHRLEEAANPADDLVGVRKAREEPAARADAAAAAASSSRESPEEGSFPAEVKTAASGSAPRRSPSSE